MKPLRYLNPLQWGRWFAQFVHAWAVSIPWDSAPKAIPAFLLLLVLLVTGVIAYSDGNRWRSNLMGKQFKTAWEADDYETAELVLRRQIKDRPDDTQLMFRLGLAMEEQDKKEQTTELMRRLVAMRKHEPAARWLLQNEYVGGSWNELEVSAQDELGALLTLLHEENPKDFSVKRLYADYLIATHKEEAAIPVLAQLASVQPMQGLRAAAIAKNAGQEGVSTRLAEQTLSAVNKLYEEEPTNARIGLAAAQNLLFLNRHKECVDTLALALKRAKTPEDAQMLRIAMGDAIVAWVTHIEENPTATDEDNDGLKSLQMLQMALQFAPNNPRVLALVVDRVLEAATKDSDEINVIREALVKGTSPGIAHFIRGTAALVNGDNKTAERHLSLAVEMLPRSGAIMNNLAVAMATREDADLEKALKLSNSAIESTPGASPHFYETRGQILVRLDRYEEAIPDLERALAIDTLAANAHVALAKCYDSIGEKEIAEQHREAAEERKTESQ